uniref:tRNA-splicing endonuclease subunit Sen2 n=1 Tax=Lepisosteus oculatus TaxID=7918 RepID=W5N998_LEPOC|nr:PREDICTED: tRNA-splicing endonuclease subunit Sen2 [Lepisosteus oculatus]XP_015203520.1 PREDICTED: tRNA-splicing endonuclease subunit Sen2 [Lepisosteus oculatus]XP_015203521.1 PREDICTED: tRNA-splicing endonuclease subunit Sen2 [Lepisosteus oculatus]
MTEAVFQAPKRRARVYESYAGPFPVTVSADKGQNKECRIYRAEIVNQHVLVRDPEDIQALYGKGYFGKGILSRSRPEYNISDKWQNLGSRSLPVISSSKYQLHLNWAQDILREQGLDEESIHQALEKYTHPVDLAEANRAALGNGLEQTTGSTSQGNNGALGAPASPAGRSSDSRQPDRPECEAASWSPEKKKPRRQGDPCYDPLADSYSDEPVEGDREDLRLVKCDKHDDWLVHCGCRLKDRVMETRPDTRSPSFSPGYEYVLVREEEEEEIQCAGENENSLSSSQTTERFVWRINPFRIIEYLQLSLEEAFFLVYALGCLSIYHNGDPLTILNLWEIFSSIQPSFQTSYVAYHYFRSKGWVPKIGMKYGTDFLLYRKGPPFYHASYSVVVEKADETFQGSALRPFSWRSLAALNRITGNVSKELLLCYVIRPLDMTEEDMSTPDCLKRIKVQEIIVSRWISSRDHTEQEEI